MFELIRLITDTFRMSSPWQMKDTWIFSFSLVQKFPHGGSMFKSWVRRGKLEWILLFSEVSVAHSQVSSDLLRKLSYMNCEIWEAPRRTTVNLTLVAGSEWKSDVGPHFPQNWEYHKCDIYYKITASHDLQLQCGFVAALHCKNSKVFLFYFLVQIS